MLKPYCLFLKFGHMRHMFDILKIPNQISATLLRLFQKVWYSSITTPKQSCLFVCLERCILKKIVSSKRVSGRTVQLVRIVESSNKLAAEPHRLDKTRTNIHDM